ncbi:hypothetical protein M5E88_08710 [Akkermansia muciniphila]|nr:hypothetical protein M5E88_08710 [Akkermansia muciniphila]
MEITNRKTGSSSSYVPPEAETEPVDNNDEGDDDPCGGSSSGSSSSPNSSSSNPCPNGDNGGDEDETDPDNPFSPDDCMDNRGGSPARLPCAAWFPPPPHMESSLPQANG